MPYFFRCDYCHTEHDLGADPVGAECARTCEGCGQDGCDACLENGTCEDCREDSHKHDLTDDMPDDFGD